MINIAKVHAIHFGVELTFRTTGIVIEVKLRDQNQLKELL